MTFNELRQAAIAIRDENRENWNSASRVGSALLEIVNKIEELLLSGGNNGNQVDLSGILNSISLLQKTSFQYIGGDGVNLDTRQTPGTYYYGTEFSSSGLIELNTSKSYLFVVRNVGFVVGKHDLTQYRITQNGIEYRKHYARAGIGTSARWDDWAPVGGGNSGNLHIPAPRIRFKYGKRADENDNNSYVQLEVTREMLALTEYNPVICLVYPKRQGRSVKGDRIRLRKTKWAVCHKRVAGMVNTEVAYYAMQTSLGLNFLKHSDGGRTATADTILQPITLADGNGYYIFKNNKKIAFRPGVVTTMRQRLGLCIRIDNPDFEGDRNRAGQEQEDQVFYVGKPKYLFGNITEFYGMCQVSSNQENEGARFRLSYK